MEIDSTPTTPGGACKFLSKHSDPMVPWKQGVEIVLTRKPKKTSSKGGYTKGCIPNKMGKRTHQL